MLISKWTLIPLAGLFFECEVKMLIQIVLSVALIFLLNKDKV